MFTHVRSNADVRLEGLRIEVGTFLRAALVTTCGSMARSLAIGALACRLLADASSVDALHRSLLSGGAREGPFRAALDRHGATIAECMPPRGCWLVVQIAV